MEKYGVKTEDEKTAQDKDLCPVCGSSVKNEGGIRLCPKCGSKPFEKKPE